MTKFSYDDIVKIQVDAKTAATRRDRAWIIAVMEDRQRFPLSQWWARACVTKMHHVWMIRRDSLLSSMSALIESQASNSSATVFDLASLSARRAMSVTNLLT
jgi:hypothetical protein